MGEQGGLGTKGIVKPDPWNSGLCPDAALVLPEVTNIVFNPWHSAATAVPARVALRGGFQQAIPGDFRGEVCREKRLWRRKTPDPGMTISSGWSCSSGKGFQDVFWGLCEQKGQEKEPRGQSWGQEQPRAQPGMSGINLGTDAPSSCQVQLDSSSSRAQLP